MNIAAGNWRRRWLTLAVRPLVLMGTFMAAAALAAASLRAGAVSPAAFSFPTAVQQGSLIIGRVAPDIKAVRYGSRLLRISPEGWVVLGVGRSAVAPIDIDVVTQTGQVGQAHISITPRDWPVDYVSGVPPKTVAPPPAIAKRIEREQAQVAAARLQDDARTDFARPFIWPVKGRISGRFGHQRVYNGVPGAPHSGIDIAAPNGTPVRAPASGRVTFAAPDLYLTGGTLLIDHGQGVSSNFLHLSRIDVMPGHYVQQGQVIGAVGATGRATGPHLHWGVTWFDTRLDPLLVLETTKTMPK